MALKKVDNGHIFLAELSEFVGELTLRQWLLWAEALNENGSIPSAQERFSARFYPDFLRELGVCKRVNVAVGEVGVVAAVVVE